MWQAKELDQAVELDFLRPERGNLSNGRGFWQVTHRKRNFCGVGKEDDVHRDLQGMARGRCGGESWKGERFRLTYMTIWMHVLKLLLFYIIIRKIFI